YRLNIVPQIFVRKRLLADGHAAEGLFDEPSAVDANYCLRQPGELKKEHVPAPSELAKVGAELFLKRTWMRTVQHDQTFGGLRVVRGECPGHSSAPVMSDDDSLFFTERTNEAHDIRCEQIKPIIGDPGRLITLIIATHIRRHDLEVLR